jgi:1,4-alpha-glucan branching enzyme
MPLMPEPDPVFLEIAFHRWNNGRPRGHVIIVVNMANQAFEGFKIGFPRTGKWEAHFNGYWSEYTIPASVTIVVKTWWRSESKRMGCPFIGIIGIGPYSAIIFSQEG